jgi:hypothetical protein
MEISRKLNWYTSAALLLCFLKSIEPKSLSQSFTANSAIVTPKVPNTQVSLTVLFGFNISKLHFKFVTKIKLFMVVNVIIQLALENHNLCITYLFVRLLFNQ